MQPPLPGPALAGTETLEASSAAVYPHAASGWSTHLSAKRAMQTLVVLAVIAIALVAGYRVFNRPTTIQTGAAEIGTVREELVGPGTVQSRYSVSVGSRVAGAIDRVLVDVGDEVQKDQLLATLDRIELDARFRSARGAVASAQEDIALAKANLAKARSDLDLARLKDQRAKSLVTPGVISVDQAEEAHGALLAAEATERASLAAVDARHAALARLVQEQRVAETILSYTAIASPMAGIVTRRALEPGSTVLPGAVVFQVVDANALWVATLVDQSLAGRVRLGQQATIHLRSGADMSGHVVRVALEADPITRELEVDVAFDARPSRFAIHEEADVTIFGEHAQGVVVTLDALRYAADGASAYVYVVEEGRALRRQVHLGIVGSDKAIVTEGLSEGDVVILTPTVIREGRRVAAASTGG